MPTTRKKAAPKRSRTAGRKTTAKARTAAAASVSSIAAAQLKQLRKTAEQLRQRLERQAKARLHDIGMLRDTRKARQKVMQQLNLLKQEGARLSRELRKALSDTNRREQARQQAFTKIAELRAELGRRTDELRRKSEDLAKLARESAGRAHEIIMHDVSKAAPEAAAKATTEAPSGETSTNLDPHEPET